MKVTLHIGLHKTGTTFLQRSVFPALDVNVVRRWEPVHSIWSGQHLLISDESLSGLPFSGDWLSGFKRKVDTVYEFFGNPSIIIGFRRHASLVCSLYKQYLHEGGTEGVEYLFSADDSGLIKHEDIVFQRRIEYLEERFDRLMIYTQEEMQEDLNGLVKRLASFLGVPVPGMSEIDVAKKNVGLKGERQAHLLRQLNRVNRYLEEKSLPTLYNRFLKRFGLDPRTLCQHRLASFPSEPLRLPAQTRKCLDDEFAGDWQFVLNKCAERGRRSVA